MASLCADGLASRGKTLMYVVGEHNASGDPLTDVHHIREWMLREGKPEL